MQNKKQKEIKTVPNQRVITIHKEPTDKGHLYTTLNLEALNDAVKELKSQRGIKLYLYLAKNQNNYTTALSSSDFCEWANCGMTAYNTAFAELEEKGYLIKKAGTDTIYTFYDKAQKQEETEETQKNEEIKEAEVYQPKVVEIYSPSGYQHNKVPKRKEHRTFIF